MSQKAVKEIKEKQSTENVEKEKNDSTKKKGEKVIEIDLGLNNNSNKILFAVEKLMLSKNQQIIHSLF